MADEDRPFPISKMHISSFNKIQKPFELAFNDLVTILIGDNGAGRELALRRLTLF